MTARGIGCLDDLGRLAHTAWTDFRGRPGINTANQDVVYVANVTP